MRTNSASGVATDATGAVSETETRLDDANRFAVASLNIDSAIDYKVEVSPNGVDWFDHGTSQTGVTTAVDDNLQTGMLYVRVNITTAGAGGETGDFHITGKGDK